MSDTLMQQGTDLMLYGMGSVLVFLTLLVIATVAMSGMVRRWFPEPDPIPDGRPRRSGAGGNTSATEVDDKVLAAIKVAIKKHRARR